MSPDGSLNHEVVSPEGVLVQQGLSQPSVAAGGEG